LGDEAAPVQFADQCERHPMLRCICNIFIGIEFKFDSFLCS
jgi:hypothetical protein